MEHIKLEYKTISELHVAYNFPPPENPLFSIFIDDDEHTKCSEGQNIKISLTCGFYTFSLKNIVSGEITYGRTKYDCSNGTMIFFAPDQTITSVDTSVSSGTYHIAFEKEFLIGSPLFDKIKKYNFFNYNVNEALHLSPKEEELIKTLFRNIETEYKNNQDEFSRELILTYLDALLKNADRFYKRQFLNRKLMNQDMYSRFKRILDDYFEANQLEESGIPTVEWLAQQLGVSHRYMSDTIKTETGKTAVDQINNYLIDEAKNLLLAPNATVSETAYALGFEYPHYFSRLFKKKVGVSPKSYMGNAMKN